MNQSLHRSASARLNIMSPKKVNSSVKSLLQLLDLAESDVSLLKYSRPSSFNPEPGNCHFNVWRKCLDEGGAPCFGWIIGQDVVANFVEAQFHTVWMDANSGLHDITPRADGEKRLMFVTDPHREITLTEHAGNLALVTYDNVRIMRGSIISPLERITLVPQDGCAQRLGLPVLSPLGTHS